MLEERRMTIIRKIFDAFVHEGSADPLMAAVSDDVECVLTIAEGTPLSGTFRGKEGLQRYFETQADLAEIQGIEILNFLAGGDQIAVAGRETLRIKRTGELCKDSDFVTLFTFREDKITRILTIEDTISLALAYRS